MESLVLWHRTAPAAHDEEGDPGADVEWLRHVRRLSAERGAQVLGPIGGALACIFDAIDVETGIGTALTLLEAAERGTDFASAPRVAFGAALGELDFSPADEGRNVLYFGAALDRAQLLANRARPGELVLDAKAREACQSTFLFHRTVGTGEASLRGHAIDREEPRVADCRRYFVHLARAPTPTVVAEPFTSVREDASSFGSVTVVVRGEVGSGARRCLSEIEFAVRPALVLRCPSVPGGLEPLGSLRCALQRAYGSGASRVSRLATLELGAADILGRIARGEVVNFDHARKAVELLLQACREPDTNKPWISLEGEDVDESTLELVGRIARDARADVLTIVHGAPDAAVPSALSRAHRLREILVPALRYEDVRHMAEKMLREPSGGEIARRVASTSADTPLAVVECVRAWIASGDVVRRGRSFVFRLGPRTGTDGGGYADWVTERTALLDDAAARMLELLATVPPTMTGAELEALAKQDGFSASRIERSVQRLSEDRFILTTPVAELDNALLRNVVRGRMPSARRAELASLVASRIGPQQGFARATLGYFLAEAGESQRAADALLDAASLAAPNGHPRACIRLASAAVQAFPSPEVRGRAAALLRSATQRVDGTGASPETGRSSVELPADALEAPAAVVVAAIRGRDYDRVDRFIDLAIAEGASLAAADRLRAVVAVLRGDLAEAAQSCARAAERSTDAESRARSELVSAIVDLHEGRVRNALRTLVEVLASMRERTDAVGEAATLLVLGMCYRALGRAPEARRLTDLAHRIAA